MLSTRLLFVSSGDECAKYAQLKAHHHAAKRYRVPFAQRLQAQTQIPAPRRIAMST
jgi:hypothetical protein